MTSLILNLALESRLASLPAVNAFVELIYQIFFGYHYGVLADTMSLTAVALAEPGDVMIGARS